MEALQSVVSLIITLGILVTIHEYGHFWVARRCGVKVLRFSVGFGKPLFSRTDKHGTEFSVAAIPLGGYVKMLDEREGPVKQEELHLTFNRKPAKQRIAIAAAGPIANFAFAIVAYWLMFMLGFNVLVPKIGAVDEESIAAAAGLQAGTEIVSVEGRETYGWREVMMALVNRIGDSGYISMVTKPEASTGTNSYRLQISEWLKDKEQTDLIASLGIKPYRPKIPAQIGMVKSGSPAELGGLQTDDVVLSVDQVAVGDWFEFVDLVQPAPGQQLLVDVLRDGSNIQLKLVPEAHYDDDGVRTGRLGVGVASFSYPPEMIREVSYAPPRAFVEAVSQTWADTSMTLGAIKKMVIGLISLDNLSGPITIAQIASQSISSGLEDFLRFLALLSVSLGVLNLLPIPVLDGGHILFYLVEVVRGKPLSEKSQLIGFKIGLSLVLAMMVVAFYNDIMRL